MENRYVEIFFSHTKTKRGPRGGNLVAVDRRAGSTTLIFAAARGSGITANLAAELTTARLRELLRLGLSLREAFRVTVRSQRCHDQNDLPATAFILLRILNTGQTTLLSYKMPPPVLIYHHYPSVLRMDELMLENEIISEAEITLGIEDGLFLFSEAISQAGRGQASRAGWGAEGVAEYLRNLGSGSDAQAVYAIIEQAELLNGKGYGEDGTVIFAKLRKGHVLNIFTGPPSHRENDRKQVMNFLNQPGIKVVCGATTAGIVARELKQRLEISEVFDSPLEPPAYHIEGIDLVTEGAITLTQVYNILLEELREMDEKSAVHQLCLFMQICDRINLWVGGASNPANTGLRFRQLGVMARRELIPLMIERLRSMGKTVVVQDC